MEVLDRVTILRWMESSKITAVTWCFNALIIGNDAGELYAFPSAELESPVDPNVYKFAKVSNKTIVRICPLEPKEWLLVLNVDGDLYIASAFFNGQPYILRKKVTSIARQQKEESSEDGAIALVPLSYGNCFCVGAENSLYIYTCNGDNVEQLRRITVDGTALATSWLNALIVVGTKEVYYAMSPEGSLCQELCSNTQVDNEEGAVSGVMTASCVDKDIIVVCGNIGIFYNTETVSLSKKNTIHWSNSLESLGCVPPFIIGITTDKVIEIFGARDQLLYQTIHHTNVRSPHYLPENLTMIAATPNLVLSMRPKGYYQDLGKALDERELKRAMHMVELYYPPDHPDKREGLKIAHIVAGWVRFSDLSFPMAFHHFSLGDLDVVHLLSFWMHYACLEVPEIYVRNSQLPLQLRKYVPNSMPIRDFVEERFDRVKASLPPGITVDKLLEMASTSFATFLLQHCDHEKFTQKLSMQDLVFHKKLLGALQKTSLLLLAECNDSRCNIIIDKLNNESFLDLEESGKHLLEMDKGEVYAKMLMHKERYREAMEIMAQCIKKKLSAEATEDSHKIRTICCEFASCLNMLIRNSQRGYAGKPIETIRI